MSTETPEKSYEQAKREKLATALAAWQNDVIEITITPSDVGGHSTDRSAHFRAVVVEGETAPIVLQEPAELGMSWPDGGDLLALTDEGIVFTPRGVDVWAMDPDEALEFAAQLAAMAYARRAADGGEPS